jgi:hypothetical protein
VEVVVAQAVSTVLMIPNIRKEKRNLRNSFMVNNGSPGVSTLGLFFVKSVGFTNEKHYICRHLNNQLWQKQSKRILKQKANFRKH